MKIELTKEWCIRMAMLEGNSPIGAGSFIQNVSTESEHSPDVVHTEDPSIAFGRFVRLMRRHRRLTVEELAKESDIDISDLVEIEDDTRHKPEPRTVYQLANYFNVSKPRLMQIAGLVTTKDSRLVDEAIRFAARSDPTAKLSPEEQAALEAFVKFLSDKK